MTREKVIMPLSVNKNYSKPFYQVEHFGFTILMDEESFVCYERLPEDIYNDDNYVWKFDDYDTLADHIGRPIANFLWLCRLDYACKYTM